MLMLARQPSTAAEPTQPASGSASTTAARNAVAAPARCCHFLSPQHARLPPHLQQVTGAATAAGYRCNNCSTRELTKTSSMGHSIVKMKVTENICRKWSLKTCNLMQCKILINE